MSSTFPELAVNIFFTVSIKSKFPLVRIEADWKGMEF